MTYGRTITFPAGSREGSEVGGFLVAEVGDFVFVFAAFGKVCYFLKYHVWVEWVKGFFYSPRGWSLFFSHLWVKFFFFKKIPCPLPLWIYNGTHRTTVALSIIFKGLMTLTNFNPRLVTRLPQRGYHPFGISKSTPKMSLFGTIVGLWLGFPSFQSFILLHILDTKLCPCTCD